MRLAGTARQYSGRAISQLMAMMVASAMIRHLINVKARPDSSAKVPDQTKPAITA